MNNTVKYLEHYLILLLIGGFLFVDTIVGAIEYFAGFSIKVSLIYKTPVLLAVCVILLLKIPKFMMWVLLGLTLLLVGPVYTLTKFSDPSALFFDLTLILKIFTPILFLRYFIYINEIAPNIFSNLAPKVMLLNYGVLLTNMVIGLAGVGYSSYAGGVGVNGFFTAGNDLGAVFLVLSAYVLTLKLQQSTLQYILFAFLTVLIGLLISTKTSILSSLALVVVLPAMINPNEFFKPTKLKISIVIALFTISLFAIVNSIEYLQSIGIWERIVLMYEKYGFLGIVLSGRDIYAADLLNIFLNHHNLFEWLFGVGSAGIWHNWLTVKGAAEIDPVDTIVNFGFVGLLITLICQLWLLYSIKSHNKYHEQPFIKAATLVFYMLLGLAFTSGHIWFSGMVGPFIGLLFGLTYMKPKSITMEKEVPRLN